MTSQGARTRQKSDAHTHAIVPRCSCTRTFRHPMGPSSSPQGGPAPSRAQPTMREAGPRHSPATLKVSTNKHSRSPRVRKHRSSRASAARRALAPHPHPLPSALAASRISPSSRKRLQFAHPATHVSADRLRLLADAAGREDPRWRLRTPQRQRVVSLEACYAHILIVRTNPRAWATREHTLQREAVEREQLQPLTANLRHVQLVVCNAHCAAHGHTRARGPWASKSPWRNDMHSSAGQMGSTLVCRRGCGGGGRWFVARASLAHHPTAR